MKTIRGISLVELLIGLGLSMIIASVITEWYIAAYKIGAVQNALLSIEENQHIAMHYLRSDLKTAGFIGCAKLTTEFPLISYSPYLLTASNFIETVGTNEITLRSMNTQTADLIAMKSASIIEVSANRLFNKEDLLIISDCQKAEIFKLKNSIQLKNTIQLETEIPLHYTYEPHAEISQLQINSYFIRKTSRKTTHNEAIYALYRSDIKGHVDELVEGLKDMQIHLLKQDGELVGVELRLQLSSVGDESLEKEVPLYVALRER